MTIKVPGKNTTHLANGPLETDMWGREGMGIGSTDTRAQDIRIYAGAFFHMIHIEQTRTNASTHQLGGD